jgi:hypothetical protein
MSLSAFSLLGAHGPTLFARPSTAAFSLVSTFALKSAGSFVLADAQSICRFCGTHVFMRHAREVLVGDLTLEVVRYLDEKSERRLDIVWRDFSWANTGAAASAQTRWTPEPQRFL